VITTRNRNSMLTRCAGELKDDVRDGAEMIVVNDASGMPYVFRTSKLPQGD
jgi:hypothetical protein